jgi:hypothetical protein
VRTPGITIRHVPVHQQVPSAPGTEAFVAAAASLADRRTQILKEFDRTYAEVQTMIEERIAESQGVEEGGGPASGAEGAAPGGTPYSPEDIQLIARDLERLRGGLRSMLLLCEELMSHLGTLLPPPAGGEPPSGGGK